MCVGVVRCVLSTTIDNDNWKRTSIFHTVIQSGDKKCKLVINGGSSMNVVSKDADKLLNLKVELHPNPLVLLMMRLVMVTVMSMWTSLLKMIICLK